MSLHECSFAPQFLPQQSSNTYIDIEDNEDDDKGKDEEDEDEEEGNEEGGKLSRSFKILPSPIFVEQCSTERLISALSSLL